MGKYDERRHRRPAPSLTQGHKSAKGRIALCPKCAPKMQKKNGGPLILSLINQTAHPALCFGCMAVVSCDSYKIHQPYLVHGKQEE